MIIESKQNPLIRQLKKCREKSGRDQYGVFLVEGTRLTFHAVKSGVHLKHLLCTPEYLEENRKLLDGLNFQLVSENVLKELCDTQHPQGIAAAVRKPDTNFENLKVGDSCFFIFCDEVRDPGNMVQSYGRLRLPVPMELFCQKAALIFLAKRWFVPRWVPFLQCRFIYAMIKKVV